MANRATARINALQGHLLPRDAEEDVEDRPRGLAVANTASASTSSARLVSFPQAETMTAFPPAVHDVLGLDELFKPEDRALRLRIRAFMESEVAPVIVPFWEKAEFPHALVPKIAQLKIAGLTLKGYGCPGMTLDAAAACIVEMARVDGSVSTFVLVHSSLAMLTIGLLGSEAHKRELLPEMAALGKVGCWALTEPSNGSDAAALTTTAKKVSGGWILNGQKRWIGNGTFADISVIWARNLDTNQINAFIVRGQDSPGYSTKKIENKIALRCVQNADIYMEDVFVPDADRLPGVDSFKDTNKVLAISRIMVAWQPVGLAVGVYDMCARYLKQRRQFGAPLGAFQLVQERMARMAGNIQAMMLMGLQLNKLHEAGKMSHEQASLVKAWNTLRGREVMALGRELLGGNGIVSDYLVAKSFCDLEAYYTYEGTYDVNSLVVGRGITGVAAIKPSSTGPRA